MLTQRDMDAGVAALAKVMPSVSTSELETAVAAVVLAVDAERSPVAITKNVLGSIFGQPYKGPA